MFKYILPYIFVSSLQSVLAEADTIKTWHTSQRSLVQLYDLQAEHFVAVNDYLRSESKRLEELKNILAKAYEWRDYRIVNRTISYLHNHINAAQTIKRIQYLFDVVEELTNNKQFVEALGKIDNYKNINEQNIRLSSQGLRRIQNFYQIPVSDMTEGKYRDRIIGDQMNACECYVMSTYCFEENSVFGAADWAIHAYKKWINGDQWKCVDIERLIFILISTSTATGFDFEHLLNSSKSNYSEHTENLARHFHQMSDEIFSLNESRTFDLFDVYNTIVLSQYDLKFRELCYQHGESSRTLTKDCVCQYQTRNSLYRILMPFKEEISYCNPYIKLYHDVIYDDEIEKIKSICSDSLDDATVISDSGGKLLLEKTRSGKVCRIFEEDAAGVLDSLNARIECFTGLSTLLAEPYQIVNYGLGGHYLQHHDAFERRHVTKDLGNRYLTVLFYMSDVQYDGSTVFPVLDIVSPARKGTALVWYNVHANNGSKDLAGLHGSCPILKGNKWIMTRWLHEVGQNLSYDWRIAVD